MTSASIASSTTIATDPKKMAVGRESGDTYGDTYGGRVGGGGVVTFTGAGSSAATSEAVSERNSVARCQWYAKIF